MPASELFNNSAYGHLLRNVLKNLDPKDIGACMQVNKETHATVVSTSEVQIQLRKGLFHHNPAHGFIAAESIDAAAANDNNNKALTSRDRLDALIEAEKLHETFKLGVGKPLGYTHLPLNSIQQRHSFFVVPGGWMVSDLLAVEDKVLEQRTICEYEGWTDDRVAFCDVDHVVVESNVSLLGPGPWRCRIFTFQFFDSRHKSFVPGSAGLSDKLPHPEAKYQSLTINLPASIPSGDFTVYRVEAYPGGLVSVLFAEPGNDYLRDSRSPVSQRCRTFLMVLDWKNGVPLGLTKMWSNEVRITDITLASPAQVVCSSVRVDDEDRWVPCIDLFDIKPAVININTPEATTPEVNNTEATTVPPPITHQHYHPEVCPLLYHTASFQLPSLFSGPVSRDTLWPASPVSGPKVFEFDLDISGPDSGKVRRDQIITFKIAGTDAAGKSQAFTGAILVSNMLKMIDRAIVSQSSTTLMTNPAPVIIKWEQARSAVATHPWQNSTPTVSTGTRSFSLVRRGPQKERLCCLVRDYSPAMSKAPKGHFSRALGSLAPEVDPEDTLTLFKVSTPGQSSRPQILFPGALPAGLGHREYLFDFGPELDAVRDSMDTTRLYLDKQGLMIISPGSRQIFSYDILSGKPTEEEVKDEDSKDLDE